MIRKPIFETKICHMIRFFFCLLFVSVVAAEGSSQNGFKPPATGIGVIYNTETTINLKLVTHRSFGIGMEFGRLQTYDKTKYYHFGIGELKHPKEYRQSADPSVSRSFRPYVFGKQNNLLVLRAGWGMKRYFSEKAKQKGVAIGMSYSFGPSLGLLKPYYLALRYTADGAGNSNTSGSRSKPHDWVGNTMKEKVVKRAIGKVLPDEFDRLDELFDLVKARDEYR